MNIICFGFEQVAKNFIKKLKDQGATFKLTATSREESKTKEFENINYESFQFTKEGFDKKFLFIILASPDFNLFKILYWLE